MYEINSALFLIAMQAGISQAPEVCHGLHMEISSGKWDHLIEGEGFGMPQEGIA